MYYIFKKKETEYHTPYLSEPRVDGSGPVLLCWEAPVHVKGRLSTQTIHLSPKSRVTYP
jgi:hypothetical protein